MYFWKYVWGEKANVKVLVEFGLLHCAGEMPILTSDDDFTNYRHHLPIDLFPVGA